MHTETHDSPKPVHLNLNLMWGNSRGNISQMQRKKDSFLFRDGSNSVNGPYDISLLKLWLDNGLLSPQTLIYESSTQDPIPLSTLIESKNPNEFELKDTSEWFLWIENQTPYQSLNNRLTKNLLLKHHQNDPLKLSIIPPAYQNVESFQEYEDFLNSFNSVPPEILQLQLNDMAQPFATWVQKILNELNCSFTLDELKMLLLLKEPLKVRAFLEKKVPSSNLLQCNHFCHSYIQWRMYIPIYCVSS